MSRFCAAAGISACLLFIPFGSGAQEVPADARVPLIAIEAERAISAREIEAVKKGLGSPVTDDLEMMERLSLLPPLDSGFVASMAATFEKGQNHFYAGRHEEAGTAFESVVEEAESNPAALISAPDLREIAFKARIHLAAIADVVDGRETAEEQLSVAAAGFPDLEPSTAEFPPWIHDRFKSLRRSEKIPSGEVTVDTLPGCELVLSGKVLGKRKRYRNVSPGPHSAQVKCLGQVSPMQYLRVTSGSTTSFSPLLLKRLRVEIDDKRLKFKTSDTEVVSSLVSEAVELTHYGDWPRAVVVLASEDETDLWLVDSSAGAVVRRASAPTGDRAAVERAGEKLAGRGEDIGRSAKNAEAKRWYKDPLAWTLVGTGAAALGTGIALGQVFGSPSAHEQWLWALIAVGGGMAGTGVVLFILPSGSGAEDGEDRSRRGLAAGLTASGSF